MELLWEQGSFQLYPDGSGDAIDPVFDAKINRRCS